jgi:hypothetical protein
MLTPRLTRTKTATKAASGLIAAAAVACATALWHYREPPIKLPYRCIITLDPGWKQRFEKRPIASVFVMLVHVDGALGGRIMVDLTNETSGKHVITEPALKAENRDSRFIFQTPNIRLYPDKIKPGDKMRYTFFDSDGTASDYGFFYAQ